MEYTEENCTVATENDVIVFYGKIEAAEYSKFLRFLIQADLTMSADPVIYDLRPLNFLNSSGIKAIAVHLLKSTRKYILRINAGLTWQKVGIVPLRLIKPEGNVVIEI